MSLSKVQAQFTKDICDLIEYADHKGYNVTFGEVQRPIEMQEIYIKTGRSTTMRSKHLQRLAADLNFFRREDNNHVYVVAKEELQQFGDYWESLHPQNSWGGNWRSFKDTPHFQRSL